MQAGMATPWRESSSISLVASFLPLSTAAGALAITSAAQEQSGRRPFLL